MYDHADIRALADRLISPDGPAFNELEKAALALKLLVNTIELMRSSMERHDRRVTELLEANNREVERRRAAEAELARLRMAWPSAWRPASPVPGVLPVTSPVIAQNVGEMPAAPLPPGGQKRVNAVGTVRVEEERVTVSQVHVPGVE